MNKLFDTDSIGFLFIILGIGVIIELTIYFQPLIILILAVGIIYLGITKNSRFSGKFFVIFGLIIAIFTLLASFIFKLGLFILFIFLLVRYTNTKKHPKYIDVDALPSIDREIHRKQQPYIKNVFVGNQRIVDHVYDTEDINIQCGVGETIIDLGMTVLPMGETVIVIRGFVGKIQLLVPYDVAISSNHSVMVGNISVLDHQDGGFNQNVTYYSEDYGNASRKVKILTSLVIGDIEVKNI